MRTLATLLAAAAIAVFGLAGPAYADKPDGGLHCNATQASHPCVIQAIIDITKERTDGPYTFDIEGPLNLGARTNVAVDVDPNDDGGIAVGLDAPQHFAVEIVITNNSGSTVFDLVVFDTIPAEFNLDPAGEDAATGAAADTVDGDCGTGGDGVCNGIDISAAGGCVLTAGQPAGAVAGPKDPTKEPFSQRFKEPELVSILVDSVADTGVCTFTLYLVTDGNPGHVSTAGGILTGDFSASDQSNWDCLYVDAGIAPVVAVGTVADCQPGDFTMGEPEQILLFTQYEPGTCEKIAQVTGPNTADVNVYNTVSLNDGVKIFQVADDGDAADGTGTGVDEGFQLAGPGGTLQLTPNGVDGATVGENLGACLNVDP